MVMPDIVLQQGIKHLKAINKALSHDVIKLSDLHDVSRPSSPCHNCHSNTWWLRGNEWICGRCHPDPRKLMPNKLKVNIKVQFLKNKNS